MTADVACGSCGSGLWAAVGASDADPGIADFEIDDLGTIPDRQVAGRLL